MVSPKLSPGADNASEGFIWMIYMFVMTYCLSGFKHEDTNNLGCVLDYSDPVVLVLENCRENDKEFGCIISLIASK